MPAIAGNNLGLNWGWSVGENGWKAGMDNNLVLLEMLVQSRVIDRTTNAPPGAPAAGDSYIIGPSPSGAWSGHAHDLAAWSGASWVFITPLSGWRVFSIAEGVWCFFDGTAWRAEAGSFTATLTGVSGSVTATANFARTASGVQLLIPALTGTSNSTSCTITGLPAELRPASNQAEHPLIVEDNGTRALGRVTVQSSGVITVYPTLVDGSSDWTSSGTKSVARSAITYLLA